MPRLSHDQRVQITTLFNQGGHTALQLAAQFNCDRRTIDRLLQKERETNTVDDRPRAARRPVTSQREDRLLVRLSAENPYLVARQLRQRMKADHGV